ncbi:MAG: hypothetical protein M9918_24570 [Anaerolineae bacterium]|nr:hypothetical protein [Anaerolineae bacterium]
MTTELPLGAGLGAFITMAKFGWHPQANIMRSLMEGGAMVPVPGGKKRQNIQVTRLKARDDASTRFVLMTQPRACQSNGQTLSA